ncbi:MAG: ATPase [Acidimicrobiia bacterium]|nr:ATPase [Acidimicrobiia bacterium]
MTNTTKTPTPVPDTIERVLVLPHAVERVWAAITDPHELAGWFGDTAEVDLRPGGAALFTWGGRDRSAAVVEVVDPPRRFAFWWTAGVGEAVGPENRTLVEFTLEPVDGGTRLRLVESGFAALAHGLDQHRDNTEGWATELGHLEAYLRADVSA